MGETPNRELEVELPIGYLDPDGEQHRTAVLRKMTGRDEALMAEKGNRQNGARMITELLASCVVRLGSIERPGRKVVEQLYSVDRHYLLMKLREFTFGPEMEASYSCPTCREATVTTEDLAELEVVRLEGDELPEDVVVALEDGYIDREGRALRHARVPSRARYRRGEDRTRRARERLAGQERADGPLSDCDGRHAEGAHRGARHGRCSPTSLSAIAR